MSFNKMTVKCILHFDLFFLASIEAIKSLKLLLHVVHILQDYEAKYRQKAVPIFLYLSNVQQSVPLQQQPYQTMLPYKTKQLHTERLKKGLEAFKAVFKDCRNQCKFVLALTRLINFFGARSHPPQPCDIQTLWQSYSCLKQVFLCRTVRDSDDNAVRYLSTALTTPAIIYLCPCPHSAPSVVKIRRFSSKSTGLKSRLQTG